MSATGLQKLPYGNMPRLLLAWVCTEAVRTQSRELVLGRLALKVHANVGNQQRQRRESGGPDPIPHQMKRLFRCTISLTYEMRIDASVRCL